MEIHHSPHTTPLSYRIPLRTQLTKFALVLVLVLTVLAGLSAYAVHQMTMPPEQFPVGEFITIEEGTSARDVSATLAQMGVVRSATAFYLITLILHDPTAIKASTYKFKEPLTAFEVADRVVAGEFGYDVIRFVHFEGERNEYLAERAAAVLPEFDSTEFMRLTAGKEGRLFPDTYIIPETFTAAELVALLEENFESKIAPLRPAIRASNFTEEQVVIVASLLEREADSRESKRMVAGIINNRLEAEMPLQLDASIEYVLEAPYDSQDLAEALRTDESPYNTYKNLGLPPTPIGNPGLTAIEAVLRPLESNYLFYLTGTDGNFYYARTLEGHNANIARYLR